jgi:hypothetical protein
MGGVEAFEPRAIFYRFLDKGFFSDRFDENPRKRVNTSASYALQSGRALLNCTRSFNPPLKGFRR